MTRRLYVPRAYQAPATHHMLEHERCALWGTPGVGKQQPNSEPVLTPNGWVPMGSLRVGDCVTGANGEPTPVLGVFPQGLQETVRVTFSDGAWCRVGWEHLWYVQSPHQHKRGAVGHVMTTRQLVDFGLRWRNGNRGEDSFWYIPLTAPVRFAPVELPLDPYLLGVILGDGSLTEGGSVTVCTDTEIIQQAGLRLLRPHATCEYVSYGSLPGAAATMCALGLEGKRSWEKFVPEPYLRGTPEQRLALIQGLLDTDGSPIATGGVEFSSTAEALADAVVDLARSLGGVATKARPRVTQHQNGEGRPSWRVNVKLPPRFDPFRLQRKLARWVRPSKYLPIRKIESAEVEGMEPATCIKVAAADSLYLTRDYVVTHNTLSTLTALSILYMTDVSEPTLIVGPLRVARRTWSDECARWEHLAGLDIAPIVGTEKQRLAAMAKDVPLYTTNYENLAWLIKHWGERWPYRIVVADEADQLKGSRSHFRTAKKRDGTTGKTWLELDGGARAKALAPLAQGDGSKIERFIELTGTPSSNGLKDLWGQLWFLDAGERLGRTYSAFMERWFEKGYDGYEILPRSFAQEEIQDRVKDICLSIQAKDYFPLKDPVQVPILVELPAHARQLYHTMERHLFAQIGARSISAANSAVKTQKLLQVASGSVYLDHMEDVIDPMARKDWEAVHDAKLQALDSLISELMGATLIVVYEFWSDLQRLLKAFPKARVLKTQEDEDDFKAGKVQLLLMYPKAGGHGIDGFQHVCHHMCFYSHSWSLGLFQQVVERIGPTRQYQSGYDRNVFLYYLIAKDTADEEVMESREGKRTVQEILMDATSRRAEGRPSAWREKQESAGAI